LSEEGKDLLLENIRKDCMDPLALDSELLVVGMSPLVVRQVLQVDSVVILAAKSCLAPRHLRQLLLVVLLPRKGSLPHPLPDDGLLVLHNEVEQSLLRLLLKLLLLAVFVEFDHVVNDPHNRVRLLHDRD